MRILRRAGGVIECQNNILRLRLKPAPDNSRYTLIIHHLKENGYIKKRETLEINSPYDRAQASQIFQAFVANVLQN